MWQVSKSADPDQTRRRRRGGWSGSTHFAYVRRSLFAWHWPILLFHSLPYVYGFCIWMFIQYWTLSNWHNLWLRCGCGAVEFIFSIYLKPVLYPWTPNFDDWEQSLKQGFWYHKLQKNFSANIWPASREKGPWDICKMCRPRPAAASPTQRLIRVCTFWHFIHQWQIYF